VTDTYDFHLSEAVEDPEWDAFVERSPGGNHVQTSLWGQVKAAADMRAVRVTATKNGSIVGGGQILFATIPIIGTIAYVSRGPLLKRNHGDISALLIDRIRSVAFDAGARHITIQPPIDGFELESTIEASGFRSTPVTVAPPASVVVDLAPSVEEILARMNKKTRYNIRLAERRGLTAREGSEEDLGAYLSMVESTAARQEFDPFPREYYRTMWKVLEPRGFLRFTIVEYEGKPLASMFAIPFGDRTISKLNVWSGEHGKHHPNELLHWEAIKWSKENGLDFYDFEGVDLEVARRATHQGTISQDLYRGVTSFKVGFGGELKLFPGAYFDARNAALRWAYGAPILRVVARKPAKKVIERLRTRSSTTDTSGEES
jgi:peptidoglycan pentaglycine glycine transferase (the first glycine)